jgi:hypothetical protein
MLLLVFRMDAQERFLEHVFADLKPEARDAPVPPDSALRTARIWGIKPLRDETTEELAQRLTEFKKGFVSRYPDQARMHGSKTVPQMRGQHR